MRDRESVYINGTWTASSGSKTYTVVNPTTEEAFGTFVMATPGEVNDAVVCAKQTLASAAWRETTLEERCAMVERIHVLMQQRRGELSRLSAETIGAPYTAGLQLGGCLALLPMYLEAARSLDFEYLRYDPAGGITLVTRQPVGVVAGVLPWNTPLRSEVKKTIPALLAGCTVVLKPSLEGTFSAFEFVDICAEAGVPPGVINLVPGDGATGEALVRHPLVNKIAFTGSTVTGTKIAEIAGPSLTRLQLELGGKAAAVLLDDFQLETTIPFLTRGNWQNSGQMCVALSRVLVPRARCSEVVDALLVEAERLVVGDPLHAATVMGPLVSREHKARVESYIKIGESEGARRVSKGSTHDFARGWFVPPTIFTGVDRTMRVANEEIFGPVVCVMPYDDEKEAVDIANQTAYGLHSAVYGRDEGRALRVARTIEAGTVAVNGFYVPLSAPFGGVKMSGIGREHGPEGYDSFLEYISYNISQKVADGLDSSGIPVR